MTVVFGAGSAGWFNSAGKFIGGVYTTTSLSSTKWTFITYLVDIDVGISIFFNAVKERFSDVNDATLNSNPPLSCSVNIIGAKQTYGAYDMNGDLDEVKYFYRVLTPTGTK